MTGIGNRAGGSTNEAMRLASTRAARLTEILTAGFTPAVLTVNDDSAHHAGHAGAGAAGETHYSVLLVSAAFQGMTRVARSRAVHAALASEFGEPAAGGMHALALTLRTPEEHRKLSGS